jgi:hypothetical protein
LRPNLLRAAHLQPSAANLLEELKGIVQVCEWLEPPAREPTKSWEQNHEKTPSSGGSSGCGMPIARATRFEHIGRSTIQHWIQAPSFRQAIEAP